MAKAYEVVIRPILSHDLATLIAWAITEADNWPKLEAKGVVVVVRPVKVPKFVRNHLLSKGQEASDGSNT